MSIVWLQACNVEPAPTCPSGQEIWVVFNTSQTWIETVFPPFTAADLSAMSSAVLVLFALAWSLRLIVDSILNKR
jgi:hypothetical protein